MDCLSSNVFDSTSSSVQVSTYRGCLVDEVDDGAWVAQLLGSFGS